MREGASTGRQEWQRWGRNARGDWRLGTSRHRELKETGKGETEDKQADLATWPVAG